MDILNQVGRVPFYRIRFLSEIVRIYILVILCYLVSPEYPLMTISCWCVVQSPGKYCVRLEDRRLNVKIIQIGSAIWFLMAYQTKYIISSYIHYRFPNQMRAQMRRLCSFRFALSDRLFLQASQGMLPVIIKSAFLQQCITYCYKVNLPQRSLVCLFESMRFNRQSHLIF